MTSRLKTLKTGFLKLLKEDEEFRYAIAGLIGFEEVLKEIKTLQQQTVENSKRIEEHSRVLEEHSKRIEELSKRIEEHSRVLEEHSKRIEELSKRIEEHSRVLEEHSKRIEELSKRIEEHSRVLEEHSKRIEELSKRVEEHSKVLSEHGKRIEELALGIQALGARWGLLAEDTFRNGVRGLVEEYFGGKVEEWIYRDAEGFVFGYPSIVEVDLVVKDGKHVLVEIKSSASRADVFELWRMGQLYERVKGVRPALVIVSPYVERAAEEVAKELDIEIYTSFRRLRQS
ncbi:MAG: DUF3782 domain-containing protein [Zestosphaera sp.]